MHSPTACPPEELLAELVDGTLQELPTLLLVEHLRRCPACQMRVGQHVAVVRWVAARWGEAPSVAMVAAAAAAEVARGEVAGEAAGRSAADVARHVADRVARETVRRPGLRPVDSTETPAPRLAEPGRAVWGPASPAGLWRRWGLVALGVSGRVARRMLAGSWGMATGAVRATVRTGSLVGRLVRRRRHTPAPSPASPPSPSGRPFAPFAPFAGLTPGTLWTLPWRAFAWMVPGARTGRRPGSEGARRWAPA